MSVIGKMSVRSAKEVNGGQRVELTVVCADPLMAHYHPENEDVVFTRYSPSGEVVLSVSKPIELPSIPTEYESTYQGVTTKHTYEKPCELYLFYTKQEEQPNLEGSCFFSRLRVVSRTDFGSDMKQFELCSPYRDRHSPCLPGEVENINIKLGIDNPAVEKQFIPAETGWWVVAYRADLMTMEEALVHAHS